MPMHPWANNNQKNYTHTLNSYRSNNYPYNIQLDNIHHQNHFYIRVYIASNPFPQNNSWVEQFTIFSVNIDADNLLISL